LHTFLSAAPRYAGLAATAYIAHRAACAARAAGGHGDEFADQLSPAWRPAADGLRLYASALAWRVFATVGGYLVLAFAMSVHSQVLVKPVLIGLPLLALVTSAVMTVGIVRYARQPAESGAGVPAWMAAVVMAAGVLLEGYGLVLLFRWLAAESSSYSSYHELRALAEQAQLLSLWAMGLGLVALLSLLFSFAQLARHIQRVDLAEHTVVIGVFLAGTGAAALGFRSYAASSQLAPGASIAVGMIIVAAATCAVLTYLTLVNNLAMVLGARRSRAELPAARVIRG
jgi:hypothetical protein